MPLARLCPRCGNVVTHVHRCGAPPRPSERRKADRPEWRTVYNTSAWKHQRDVVLRRDAYTCQRCGAPATHAGHVSPFVVNGEIDYDLAFSDSNIQAECSRCNGREAQARQHGR